MSQPQKFIAPRRICAIIAGLVTILATIGLGLLSLSGKIHISPRSWGIGIMLFFGASYAITYSVLKMYLQARLGQIYLAIRQYHKDSPIPTQPISMSKNIFDQVGKDVTEWAKEVDKREKSLEQLATYRREFIGNFSHEIQTPIFNIQGYIETLLDGAMDDNTVRHHYLRQASKNVTRLQSIVEDLTIISRIESNKNEISFSTFDIILLIKDVVDEFSLKAKEVKIKLTLQSTHSFMNVVGDSMAIRQVVSNLVGNSIKYGKLNGKTIITILDMQSYVIIQISDNGIGIEAKHLEHLCDRFYRVSKSRSRLMGGTGLGLSIVKHILEVHNQSLQIKSKFGKGSTFSFQLPKS